MFNKNAKILETVPASTTLKSLGQISPEGATKISEIIEEFHENGILLAIIFFSFPVAVPLPYPPGFTTIMGVPLIVLSLQLLMGSNKVWLPNMVNNYEIKNSTIIMICNKIVPIIITIERYVKPRFSIAKTIYAQQFVGLISIIAAIIVALPIPFTNSVPALGISVMTLGLLNRDGLVIIIGFIISIIGTIIAISAVVASWVVLQLLFRKIF